jgi:hypothetical protein
VDRVSEAFSRHWFDRMFAVSVSIETLAATVILMSWYVSGNSFGSPCRFAMASISASAGCSER